MGPLDSRAVDSEHGPEVRVTEIRGQTFRASEPQRNKADIRKSVPLNKWLGIEQHRPEHFSHRSASFRQPLVVSLIKVATVFGKI
jgi:hypothetical protein